MKKPIRDSVNQYEDGHLSEINIRPFRDEDKPKLVKLLATIFEGWPHIETGASPIDYWTWKYQANPISPSTVFVAEKDGELISCHHKIILNLKIGKEIVKGGMAVDFGVHPDYRGTGLSSKTSIPNEARGTEMGIKVSYWITSNPLIIKTQTSSDDLSKRRPYFPQKIVNLTRIQDINLQIREMPVKDARIKKAGFRTLKTINRLKTAISPTLKETGKTAIVTVTNFDKRVNVLWEKTKEQYDFIAERKADYLNWKYCDKRAGPYRITYALDDDDNLLGYAIQRINRYREEYPVGYLVDLMTLPDRLDVAHALAEDSTHYFDENNVNISNFQIPRGHPYEAVLNKSGYIDSKIRIHLFYLPYGGFPGMKQIEESRPNRIMITWGDHDVLPVKMPKVE